jgi:RNA polymerase sigma-70 factor (ECF subfamily)
MVCPEVADGDDPSASLGDDAQLDDERRLVECARTDRSAFALLYRRHVNDVYRFAYRRSGSKEVAEEATSATFERALRGIAQFEWRGTGVRPWLLRIASNEVAEIYRRSSRATGARGQIALRALAPDERVVAGFETHIGTGAEDGSIDRAMLHRALHGLPERYRDAITLRYLAGMSADEAATELGWTKAVLAVTLHRGLKALRTALSEQPDMIVMPGRVRPSANRSVRGRSGTPGQTVKEVFRETNPT